MEQRQTGRDRVCTPTAGPVAADLHPGLKASNAELTLHPSHSWVGPFLGSSRTFDTDEQSQVSESMSCQVASPESVPVCAVHT